MKNLTEEITRSTQLMGLKEETLPTWRKLINTAEKDGYIKDMEGAVDFVTSAAQEIANEYDKLADTLKPTFRDQLYKKFLIKIGKHPKN